MCAISAISKSSVPNLTLHAGDAKNAVVYLCGVGQIDLLSSYLANDPTELGCRNLNMRDPRQTVGLLSLV